MDLELAKKLTSGHGVFCRGRKCQECKYNSETCEIEYALEKIESMKENNEELETFELIGSIDLTLDTSKVDSPDHYNKGSIEVIDAIEDWKLNFNLGNAIKYIARCNHKNSKTEDLKKAIWYINREIEKESK